MEEYWICPECHVKNYGDKLVCSMCGYTKKASKQVLLKKYQTDAGNCLKLIFICVISTLVIIVLGVTIRVGHIWLLLLFIMFLILFIAAIFKLVISLFKRRVVKRKIKKEGSSPI